MTRVLAVATMASLALAVPQAANEVAYVLVSGQRLPGVEVSMSAPGPETPTGEMNLQLANGEERNIDRAQVAVIEYVPGRPSDAELRALPHDPTNGMVTFRDGTDWWHGRMIDLRPTFLRWSKTGGGTEDIPVSRIARVYLNVPAARDYYHAPPLGATPSAPSVPGAPGSWRGNEAGPITVPGSEAWTNTGLRVERGDMLQFSASGEVRVAADRTANPGGVGQVARNLRLPVPRLPLGGLIGKIDDEQPFAIGSSTEAIQIRRRGTLWLGINDDNVGDNSGAFVVTVRRNR